MSERILPFYVLCDASHSMSSHIDILNDGLRELHHAVGTDSVVAEKTQFCLIGFSGTAEVAVPLCRLSDLTEITRLVAKAATSFGAAFDLLRATIERDMEAFSGQRCRMCRPAVFFLSDGQSTDPFEWPAALDRLTDPAWAARPDMIAFGIGDADAATIGHIGAGRAFLSLDGTGPEAALREFTRALTDSIIRTGAAVAAGGGAMLRVPHQVPGFVTLTGLGVTPASSMPDSPSIHRC